MPASRRKRVRRLAAGVSASALAVVALSPSARAFDRELTVGPAASSGWQGRAALFSRASPFDPATLTPCGSSIADVCDTTLLHVDPASTGSLQVRLSAVDANTPDVDLYVYRSDALGLPGRLEAVSAGPGPDEQVDVPAASGSYLVSAVSFSAAVIGPAAFRADAMLAARPATPPDVDDPRGLRDVPVSDPDAGAAEQPALARRHHLLVAAYRVFPDAASYRSRIATAVSFDGGAQWSRLGTVGEGANPGVAFDGGDAVLSVNEQGGVTLRRWRTPSRHDVLRSRTWDAPVMLDAPPAGAVDDRPVIAGGDALLACWIRHTSGGAFAREAVLCGSGGAPVRVSPAATPGVPYGPYAGGVAVAAARHAPGSFSVAWIDTLGGVLDGTGLDSAWSSHSADGGATWSLPVRAARFHPLPQHFAGDGFRNVGILSLAAARDSRLYLAYASEEASTRADVRLVRSDDGGAHWSAPTTVAGGDADQFQPSVAANARGQVLVSFLDRRLDPANRFADEWLARSADGGATWTPTRLSHDSWDPGTGAPHSPTGDLLGDHQALAAGRCSAVALAADPHLANPRGRDRWFDRPAVRSAVPQLFAWRVRSGRC